MHIRNIFFLIISVLLLTEEIHACTRFTYTAPENTVITARTMDWFEDPSTEIWAFPADMTKSGGKASNSVKWKSKYGSVIASAYDASVDGINSQGLCVNLLYLSTSDYGKANPEHQNISIYSWSQYILDNYATVNEAVKGMNGQSLNMLAPPFPNGMIPTVHLAVTDSSGDNAIFEYVDGRLVTHHGKQYVVMTNEPTYDKQLALNDYWQRLKGEFLPGTAEPDDRFVRAVYYVNAAPKARTPQESVAISFSIIRNLSVPITAKTSERPNVASTIWRSVADLKNKTYYFESVNKPNIFWIDLDKLNLQAGASVKKLPMVNNEIYAGEVSQHFVDHTPYIFP